MKKTLSMKAVILVSMILWVLMARFLGGCSASKDDGGKVRDLEFTVVSETEIPEELQKIITCLLYTSYDLRCFDILLILH